MPRKPTAGDLTTRAALEWYRAGIARAARGDRLTAEESARVDIALAFLGLPEYAWGRDVAAARRYHAIDDGYLRDELLVVHPHVLLPLDQAEQIWDARRVRLARRAERQTT